MAVEKTRYSSEEFWDFVNLPENQDRFFERIDGEIIEYMPGNPYSSAVAARMVYLFTGYLVENPVAHITTADGGYDVTDDDTFAPDMAVILKARQAQLPKTGFNPIPPDIVVEVVSPSDLKDSKRRIEIKLQKYIAVEIPLILYVYAETKTVVVYRPGKPKATLDINGVIDCGDVLPGFTLAVRDIFPD